jgi:hypothetical protein
VNSASFCAACLSSTAVRIEADALNIAGSDPGLCVDGSPDLDIAAINTGVPPASDPLRHIPPPKMEGMPRFGGIINEDGYFPPGYYPQGIHLQGTHTVCLGPEHFPCPPPRGFEPSFATPDPAIYVVDNASGGLKGLVLDGISRLFAYQVMIYVKGNGIVKLASTNRTEIFPADLQAGGLYGGIGVFQARDNAAIARIVGSSDTALQGTLYFPGAELLCTGTGIPVGNQLISRRLEISGTGEWNIDYDGRFAQPYCPDPDGDGRFTICHHPPGTPGHAHSITVLAGELPEHLAHGDQCEACPWETATPPATTTHEAPP